MKPKAVIILGFIVAAAAIVFFTLRRQAERGPSGAAPTTTRPPAGSTTTPEPPRPQVTISLIYSTEKKDWIEAATVEFEKKHPEIDVTLTGRGSLESAADILDGKQQPTLWSPADSLALRLLDVDWATKNGAPLFADSGDDAPQPLLITPLVFAIWEDRAEVLAKASGGRIGWKAIHKAVASNQGWPAIGGKDTWGFVKLGHTNPTRSNSGLQALFLMSLEFYGKRSLEVGDVLKPDYQKFVQEIERGVSKFETSTGTFMTDMVRFGPSKYDIAVVYESLAIGQIENAQGRWGNLKVYYPDMTVWSDHPIALLAAPWITDAQKAAARTYVAFLRDTPMQERALAYGFRPADPRVAMRGVDPTRNPFARLAAYGISMDVPPAVEPPDGAVVRNLLMMWSRLVGTK